MDEFSPGMLTSIQCTLTMSIELRVKINHQYIDSKLSI